MSLEVKATKANFEEEVLKSDKTVLVDFWASWCGPCRMLAPIIEEIAEEYKDTVKVCKVNTDEEQRLAAAFKIQSIPTVMIFKNGKVTDVSIGLVPKEKLTALL